MATEEKEGKGRNLFTKDEVVDLLKDKKNWWEVAHVGLNYGLENNPLNKIPGAGRMAKIGGPPLKIAQTAGEVAWALATPENRANNKKYMEELADTSVMNRLASGYLNTGANLAGGFQLMKEYDDSMTDALESSRALMQAQVKQAEKSILEFEEQSKFREIDNQKRKVFMDDLLARRDAEEAERVLMAEEKRKKMMEPDPKEEAAKIARAIRQQRELDGGG